MYVVKQRITVTTVAAGTAEAYVPVVNGRVLSIRYIKATTGGYSDGVDFTITGENSGIVIWDQDDVNASATVLPRQKTHTTAGVEGTTLDYVFLAAERIKIAIANGGDKTTGTFEFLIG